MISGMDLLTCSRGSTVEVQWIDLDDNERTRLRELGIREGAVLHVVNCGAAGTKVVALGADRFAIDGQTCACIAVVPQAKAQNVALVGGQDLAAPAAPVAQAAPAAHHNTGPEPVATVRYLPLLRLRRVLANA